MRWPLRRQILLPMIVILLLTVTIVSALNAWLASARVHRQMQQQVRDIARVVSASNFPLESNVLRQLRGLTGAIYAVVDQAGRALASSDEAFSRRAENNAGASGDLDARRIAVVENRRYFHVRLPVERGTNAGGQVALHMFLSEAAWREARWQALWPPLAIGAVSLVLVALVVSLLTRRIARPIADLQRQVSRIADGDFRPLPVPATGDEVQSLAIAVNQMAQRLVQYEDQIRSNERLRAVATLGAGVAHQIRNAATGCRLAIDLHRRDRSAAPGGPVTDESIQVAGKQLDQIEASVQRLLALGRPAATEKSAVDLAAIMNDAISLVRPMASHVKTAIQATVPTQPVKIHGNASALTQLVINLVMNAVEAAAQARLAAAIPDEEAKVAVELSLNEDLHGSCRLAVGNVGPGPSPAIQARLFTPFATDKPGGTGLGLAVARQIADDHGGAICWEQRDRMTWFLLTLPIREAGNS
jgi:signal transduction histidine kinase